MEVLTEDEILSAFDASQGEIPVPNLDVIEWPVLDYLGWIDPEGHHGYLVIRSPVDGSLKGTVLRRSRFGARKPGFEMCSLCHHVHRPDGTAMFTITCKQAGERHLIGNIVCKNLDCSLRIRNLLDPPSFLNETLYPEAKIWRMQIALHKWLKAANRL